MIFARDNVWLPRVVGDGEALHLEIVGGADALHDPRVFRIPIGREHLEVLRADLARHLILSSALRPLCDAAGIDGPVDERAAVAVLDTLLRGTADDVDTWLRSAPWDRAMLVAHGADVDLLESGRVVASLSAATEASNWQRAQVYQADRNRARRGVTLAPLDAEVLRFTGQYVHGSTIPRRDPDAVDPALLAEVLNVIEVAERASAHLRISRDPRRGATGTDKAGWNRMQDAVGAALRDAYPDLASDAVKSVSFLMCSEAARRAREQPFDPAAVGGAPGRERTLAFSDDTGGAQVWSPGDARTAVEAFWQFVAERVGSDNDVFTLEDEALDEGIQLHFSASSIARVNAVAADGSGSVPRVEYALVDDLTHYLTLVREYVAGGCGALAASAVWMSSDTEFEAARRRRDSTR